MMTGVLCTEGGREICNEGSLDFRCVASLCGEYRTTAAAVLQAKNHANAHAGHVSWFKTLSGSANVGFAELMGLMI